MRRRFTQRIVVARWVAPLRCAIRANHSGSDGSAGGGGQSDPASHTPEVAFPMVQLPARTLLTRQRDLDVKALCHKEYDHLIEKVIQSRKYYQYPSLSAPQIGWNVRMFTLSDDSVWINPMIVEVNCPVPSPVADGAEIEPGLYSVRTSDDATDNDAHRSGSGDEPPAGGKNCWAWEPCASCAFLMHYIERPGTCRIRALDREGRSVERVLTGMTARLALHEMDHMDGVLFTRRIPDTNHVVLADGFSSMSDWSDDYPSLEARSTFLYTTFTPPHTFISESVPDAAMLDRKFEDGIYPGHEFDRQLRVENAAYEEVQRAQWRNLKDTMHAGGASVVDESMDGAETGEEELGHDAAARSSPS